MPDQDENNQKTDEENAEDSVEFARPFEDRWRWIEERIGEKEWKRLTRNYRLWASVYSLRRTGFIYVLILALIAAIVMVVNLIKGRNLLHDIGFFPVLPILVAFFLFTTVMLLVLEHRINSRLMALSLEGHSPTAINDALSAYYDVCQLESNLLDIMAKAKLEDEITRGPPWWRTELTGFHLILWVSLAIAVAGAIAPGLQNTGLWAIAFFISIVAGVIKLGYWVLWGCASPTTRQGLLRIYRWGGSFISLIVVIFGIIMLVGCMIFLLFLLEKIFE